MDVYKQANKPTATIRISPILCHKSIIKLGKEINYGSVFILLP